LKPSARTRKRRTPGATGLTTSFPLSSVTPRKTSSIQTFAFGSVTTVIVRTARCALTEKAFAPTTNASPMINNP
jgi:hypothetical protein